MQVDMQVSVTLPKKKNQCTSLDFSRKRLMFCFAYFHMNLLFVFACRMPAASTLQTLGNRYRCSPPALWAPEVDVVPTAVKVCVSLQDDYLYLY